MLPGGMKVTLYAINASTGAFDPIRAKITSRRVEIIEDAASNAGAEQGLQYYFVDTQTVPNNNAPITAPPTAPAAWFTTQDEPIIIGDPQSLRSGYGAIVGNGPQDMPGAGGSPTLGTILIYIRSNGAATSIRVTEWV